MRDFDPANDPISAGGLDAIGTLLDRYKATGFDVPTMNGYTRKVQAVFAFEGVAGPEGQIEALQAFLELGLFTETLLLNLVELRRRAAEVLEPLGPCDHFDHHGDCQSHFCGNPCSVGALRDLVEGPS